MTPRSRKRAGDPSRAVAYIRVSTEEQHLGPEAQRAAIERWAAGAGVEVAAWHEDRMSGASPLDRRPGLVLALADLVDLGAGVLVVAKRDRLARDVVVAAMVEGAAAARGAVVVSAAGEGNGDDPAGLLMRRIVDVFSEYERAMIRARTKAALAAKARRGERVGTVPYGWRVGEDGARLMPDPEEEAVLERIRAMAGAGMSLRAIADALNRAGTPARGARWHFTGVGKLLRRPSEPPAMGRKAS